MNCDKDRIIHYINNELSPQERTWFEQHLMTCADCSKELGKAESLFFKLSEVEPPEPSANMELRFQQTLDSYKKSVNRPSFWATLFGNRQPSNFQLAFSIILLIASVTFCILWLNKSREKSGEMPVTLTNKVEEMRRTMILTLLENPSPTERLKAVSFTEEAFNVDGKVIDALFTTLNRDPNVNVRLAALETLTSYEKKPEVRQKLVQSISQQDSPLVQAALADVMLKWDEKRSVNSFKSLLEKQDVVEPVKKKIEKTIQTLEL